VVSAPAANSSNTNDDTSGRDRRRVPPSGRGTSAASSAEIMSSAGFAMRASMVASR
jgi:hypothetical protein